VRTHFDDSAGESTTSSTSSIKGENSGNNGSDLNKGNILKPTFDTLTEEGRKAYEAYRTNLEELFLLCCEVTWHRTVLKDTTPIVFYKAEVIPEVRPNPSLSRNDIQVMINSALERQAKSTYELLHRLIKERDGKKLDATSVNPSSSTCAVSFTQTNPHTSDDAAEPPSRIRLLLLGCRSKLQPVCSDRGTRTPRMAFLCQTLVRPHIPPGITDRIP
jgi:hypothetical protein